VEERQNAIATLSGGESVSAHSGTHTFANAPGHSAIEAGDGLRGRNRMLRYSIFDSALYKILEANWLIP
jgi:hypothetical protein